MKHKIFKEDIFRLIQGIIVGGGAILPGVSGGVLCAAFGLYMPLMQLLAHPLRELRRNWRMWLFVFLGVGIGFVGLAFGVSMLLEKSSNIAMCLFAGLVFGTLPALFREARSGAPDSKSAKYSKAKYIAMAVSFVVSSVVFCSIKLAQQTADFDIAPNIWWYGFCGILWGMSFIVPGMTSSSILMLLGLYAPMTEGIYSLDLGVILPMAVGVLVIVLTLSRLVNRIFAYFFTEAYFAVIGVVVASTIAIIPASYPSAQNALLCLLYALLGIAVSYIADKKLHRAGKG